MKIRLLIFLGIVLTMLPCAAEAISLFNNSQNCANPKALDTYCDDDFSNAGPTQEKGLFATIACRVMKIFNSGAMPLYCNILNHPEFQTALSAIMVMYITLWGLVYVTGMTRANLGHVSYKLLKMAILYAFIMNSSLFINFVFVNVVAIPQDLIKVLINGQSALASENPSSFFELVDKSLNKILRSVFINETEAGQTQQVMNMSLMIMGLAIAKLVPGGGFISAIFFTVILGWLLTYLQIMVRIIIAMLAIMFLLILGPLFMPMLFFEATKFIFEEWFRMILSFIIQMVIVIGYLLMIEQFFLELIDYIQAGFEKVRLEPEVSGFINPYSETIDRYEESVGITRESAQAGMTKYGYKGSPSEYLPKLMFDLITTLIIVIMSFSFFKSLPDMAAILAGNPKFSKVMGQDLPGQKHIESVTTDPVKKFFSPDDPDFNPATPSPRG